MRIPGRLLPALFVPALTLAQSYEVWLTDQNNTAGFSAQATRGTHGGRIMIWDGADLENSGGPVLNRPEALDLAVMFAANGPNNTTGTEVVRPHMFSLSPDQRYIALAFVASGHVAILEAANRRPKALFRMTVGEAGARQAHMASFTADGSAVIVANQNGKLLERINYDRANDRFTHDAAATLNLAECRTPSGRPCQTATPVNESDPAFFGDHNRPDTAPISPVVTYNNKVIVTLRGGGLLVVDPTSTPMAIVAEYGNRYYGRDGFGGIQMGNRVILNAGAGTETTNESGYNLYQIEDRFPNAGSALPPNDERNRPRHIAGHEAPNRDSHGIVAGAGNYYFYSFDRQANVVEIHRGGDFSHVRTVPLAGSLSSDPTVDIVALSPSGSMIFLALRGPRPQTGAHAAEGITPGLGIFTLSHGGTWGTLTAVGPITNRNPVDGGEEADTHGIAVRIK